MNIAEETILKPILTAYCATLDVQELLELFTAIEMAVEDNEPTLTNDLLHKVVSETLKNRRVPQHEVVCGNIGFVYAGTNEDEAKQVYDQFVALSLSGVGRAGHENVIWLVDGEVRIEHMATNALNVRSEEGPAENLGVCHTLMGDGSTVTQVGDLNKLPDVWSGAPADAPDPFEPM